MNTKSPKIIVALTLFAVFVTGCKTLDPYTREEKTSNATKGAMIGAAAGAVAGLISGDDAVERRQHALIGAGIGALAGGAIGNYQDRQEAELRAELEGTGVSVSRIGDNITLNMPGNVTFATNSSDLSPAFFDVLSSVGKVLGEYEKTVVEVAGHTDSTGSESYNQSLSEKRAASVRDFLAGQGINSQRMVAIGYGFTRPVGDNATSQGRAKNRRVEIVIAEGTVAAN